MKVPENQPAEMILTTSGVKNFVVRHALGSDRQISSMLHGFLNLAGKECNAGAILMDFDHANLILSQKAFEMLGFKSGTSYKLKDVEEVLSGTNSDAVSKLFLNAFEQPHPIDQEFHCEINSENKTLKLILEKADNGKQIVGLLQEMRTANKGALKMHNSTDLFEVSGIGLAVLNLKGEIFQANPSYCKLLG
ncbi:MAG: PAS domain-containing protein, partial [Luteibaculum sp.]